jgi:gas vesicle protein GvpL/GvpF
MSDGPASYLYAVGEAELAGAAGLGALRGVDGAEVRAVVEGGLAAVVSPVSRERFGEKALRDALEDLGWLEDTARAHHGVVDALAGAGGPVAPVRLATVYFGEDNVRALLARQADDFSAVLANLRGRAEWGVKGFAVLSAEPAPAPAAGGGQGPGTSYLMRRQAERDRTTRGQRLAEDAAERAHQELERFAVASRRYPPQDPRLSGQREPMLLNAAYLVPDRSEDAVRDLVDRWRDPHLRLELTGPWAAYSFATVERP